MQFSFYPKHEHGCEHVGHCPHVGGAAIGYLVHLANSSGSTSLYLHQSLDAERQRNSKLVDENEKLKAQLAAVKLELKLERQNKYATNQQKAEASIRNTDADAASSKKRGAPVGHPGWFRPTPTEYDWSVDVAAPKRCPHCEGKVAVSSPRAYVDHFQEDIIDNVYRVIRYRHTMASCVACSASVQQAGKGEILGSRIGPYLRSRAVWLRNAIGISYRKIPRIIEEMHGITFTPAALIGFESVLADKSAPVVNDIEKKLASSDGPVHADETYWTTDGARSYFWVHANSEFVHFQYDTTRAGRVSRDILGDDFVGTLVTDCYSGYTASAAGAKQKCLVHVARRAREWQKLTEAGSADFQFFADIQSFVKRACVFHRQRGSGDLSTRQQTEEAAWLRSELAQLETADVVHKKAVTLRNRLLRHQGEWLVFLDDPRVPPTNNSAEQKLRPLVVLRKITFGHRSDAGATRMAKLMTVGETARQRGHRASEIYYDLYMRPPDRVLRKLYSAP